MAQQNPSTRHLILKAARRGDAEGLKQLLAAATAAGTLQDLLATATGGKKTALHLAAERGHTEVMQLLLAAGASVNAQSQLGRTPPVFCC